jgi:hypothetical protein
MALFFSSQVERQRASDLAAVRQSQQPDGRSNEPHCATVSAHAYRIGHTTTSARRPMIPVILHPV